MKLFTLFLVMFFAASAFAQQLSIVELGRYTDGRDAACEISAYDSLNQQLYVTNAASDSLDIIDISNPASPLKVGGVNISTYGGGVNSVVAIAGGYFACAIENSNKQDTGIVAFFSHNGTFITSVAVGALPDMLALTPDHSKLLVANEGEPSDDYTNDPEGSVSIIDISGGIANLQQNHVKNLYFTNVPASISGSLKKPNTTWAQDLEPEYIAINSSSTQAAVACQESNVFIFIDLINDTITGYKGLGYKDHSIAGNGLDASNKDNTINIKTWPVHGIYQPDAITSAHLNGNTYYLSANEGDGRDYGGYSSETRIKDLTLDTTIFPASMDIQNDDSLGRLKSFTIDMIGDTDNDGDIDELYSYGARSFSIWDHNGNLIWDSGDQFEQFIAANHSAFFNCDDGLASEQDARSDDKGPEPEAITIGKIGDSTYVFIGLERQGGIFIYNITNPMSPYMVDYIHTMNSGNGTMTDIAPEGLVFVPAAHSHTGENLLIVSNEVSGTTTLYSIGTDVGLSEQKQEDQIQIYPNPSNGIFAVNYNLAMNNNITYKVYNLSGAIVALGRSQQGKFQLDLSQMPAGMYFIILNDGIKQSQTYKIIKR